MLSGSPPQQVWQCPTAGQLMQRHAQAAACSGAAHGLRQTMLRSAFRPKRACASHRRQPQAMQRNAGHQRPLGGSLIHGQRLRRRDSIRSQLSSAGDASEPPATPPHQQQSAADAAADGSGNGAEPSASASDTAAQMRCDTADNRVSGESGNSNGNGADSHQQRTSQQPRRQRERVQRSALAFCKRLWRSQTSSWRRLRRVRHFRRCEPQPWWQSTNHNAVEDVALACVT